MKTLPARRVTSKAHWMPCPKENTQYPGLAYIIPLNELIIVKESDAYHDVIGKKNTTGYTIFNNLGQKVFLAVEKKTCRKFHTKIFNYYGNEVIQVVRPFAFFKSKVLVWAPPGNFVGIVKKVSTCINAFTVQNWYNNIVFEITAEGFFRYEYKIKSIGSVEGLIANNWLDTAALGVSNYGVSFPREIGVLDKAVLIGACLLIGRMKY